MNDPEDGTMKLKDDVREKLLDAFVASAAFDGWTRKMMMDEAHQHDVPVEAVRIVFPRGGVDAFI